MFRTIRKKIFRLAFVSGAGAAAAYFFDKDKGVERRAEVKGKANELMGKASAGSTWQAQTERSANGFEPTVVPTSPSPAPVPPVVDVTVPPAPADTVPGTAATPTAPVSGA
jgi:hypothetical protein